ncbi:MAG: DUF2117 domain-containing protein [Methanomassiliicoccus sp.]|nr:DUF2117 domain-containing protein [Methanomassiliicoccus sp.]
MRFGVVVHGAEVIDSGMAVRIMDRLEEEGEVVATLGGAMGTAAIIDAGLEDRISIVPRQLVSNALPLLDRTCDATAVLNWSKSRESGTGFGSIVFGRVSTKLSSPLAQLDRDFFIEWVPSLPTPLASLINELGLERVTAAPPAEMGKDVRRLHGVRRGENIWINGTVVGRATSSDVTVRLVDGELRFENVEVKHHGLEKVRVTDVGKAVIRSGSVRRTRATPRIAPPSPGDRIILVDHRAEDAIFRAKGARAAITVGDDTTRISTSLLARLGVPVIGIVDGDEDGICVDRASAPGSVAIRLRPGNDDQLGDAVRRTVFNGADEMLYAGDLRELADTIAVMAGNALIDVKKS